MMGGYNGQWVVGPRFMEESDCERKSYGMRNFLEAISGNAHGSSILPSKLNVLHIFFTLMHHLGLIN